jgi:hypothetical protein
VQDLQFPPRESQEEEGSKNPTDVLSELERVELPLERWQ